MKRKNDNIIKNEKKKKKIDNEKICKNTTELLNNIIKIKNENENNIKKCNNYIKILQKILYKNCDHDSYRDFSSSGPGERSIKRCKKCDLIMNDYIYK